MSITACQELIKDRDPDRYMATMSAPENMRPALFALYAFNSEVVNAAWSASDPMLGEIRLQYWHDQIEALFNGDHVDSHPVLNALRDSEQLQWLAKEDFLKIIAARRWDAYSAPFENDDDLRTYLMDTSGGLMAMAARILRMNDHYDTAVREFGYAAGLAAFFVAAPELKSLGRHPLPDESHNALRALANDALDKLKETRSKKLMRVALPALLSASEADPILKSVLKDPSRVLKGTLVRAPIRKSWRLLWLEILKKW